MDMFLVYVGYIIGGFLTAVGLFTLLNRWKIRMSGIETVATVVRTRRQKRVRGDMFFPVLQYMVAGKSFEVEYSGNSFYSPKYTDGDSVRIYHHRKNPEKIMMPDNKENLITGVTCLCFGLLFLAMATIAISR